MPLFSSHSDEQLLSLYSDGNQDAFGELYERYFETLVGRLQSKFRKTVEFVAEEAVQRVFMKLSQIDSTLIENFSAWVYRSVANEAKMILREEKHDIKNKHFGPSKMQDDQDRSEEIPDGLAETPDSLVEAEELAERAKACLPFLSEADQKITRALFFEGLSERETAEKLGIPRHDVTNGMRRIRQRLLGMMSEKNVA